MNSQKDVNPEEWIKVYSEPFHLTIQDIEDMPINKNFTLFLLNINILEKIYEDELDYTLPTIKPSVFFKNNNYIVFTKIQEGIQGKWIFNKNPNIDYYKEFHIYLNNQWVPLNNNEFICPISKETKSYKELPPETKIGWRGPMMLVKDMDKCPKIFWDY